MDKLVVGGAKVAGTILIPLASQYLTGVVDLKTTKAKFEQDTKQQIVTTLVVAGATILTQAIVPKIIDEIKK